MQLGAAVLDGKDDKAKRYAKYKVIWDNIRRVVADCTFDPNTFIPVLKWPCYGPMKIFVRKAYVDLANMIFPIRPPGRPQLYCITGTPGVGKTCFFYFLLALCAKRRWKVVIQMRELEKGDLFITFDGKSGEVATDYMEVPEVFKVAFFDPELVYLVDGIEPVFSDVPFVTVLTTSPNESVYKRFEEKRSARMFYMPVFTKEELLQCRDDQSGITEQEIELRFNESVIATSQTL